ncbi:hypothetical protein R3P38DRAFT_2829114 [Favolaschia claudopus]|uniref:Uncharacterized protein n=1 Tax=Favolaschia claudopus TaxID=2862362 RepID=A0AAW0ECT6_9AGAR
MLHTPPMSAMTALDVGEHSPISPTSDYSTDEPDEEWQSERKQLIHDSFQDMIQGAKDRLERKLQNLNMEDMDEQDRIHERELLIEDYQTESVAIKRLAKEEFEHALQRERLVRKLRRDTPGRPPRHSPTISRLDLEHDQAAALKAATNDANVEAAFQSLIHPSSHDRPLTPDDEEDDDVDEIAELKEELKAAAAANAGMPEVEHISPSAGALTIKITRLPHEPPLHGSVWVKASDAAKKHELARRQKANPKPEPPPPGPPAPPPKKWVSASDAARRTSYRRIESHGS